MAEQERPGIPPSTSSQSGLGRSSEHRGTREGDVRQAVPDDSSSSMEGMRDRAGEMASGAAETVQQRAGELRDQAASMVPGARDAAYDTVESGRTGAADSMERAAENLERHAGGDGMTAMAAGAAADGMQQAAGYLRTHETAEIWEDVERYVRAHPGRSVLAAIAAGLVVGRIMR